MVHPFRPSFHVPSSPSIQRTDARARGSLLVIAISGSMRLHSLVTAITGSVRPSHVGGTARHRHLRVGAASLARHCHHRVSAAFTRWWHCSSPPSPGRCGLSCSFCSSRRPADGIRSDSPALRRTVHVLFLMFLFCLFVCSDARSFRLTVRQTVPHPRISHGMQQHISLHPLLPMSMRCVCVQQPGMVTLACRALAFFRSCFAAFRSVASSSSESSSSPSPSVQSRAMCPRLPQL